tara:strand:+ start:439 stop:573 length:135 start_codon:yes stop_codon:yes gene_type:complete
MKTFSEFNEEIQELTIGARQKRTASDRMAQRETIGRIVQNKFKR